MTTRQAEEKTKTISRGRKLLKSAAVYATSAVSLLGAVNLFSSYYGFSFKLFDAILAVLLCGLPAFLAFSWFHARPGRQKFRIIEIARISSRN